MEVIICDNVQKVTVLQGVMSDLKEDDFARGNERSKEADYAKGDERSKESDYASGDERFKRGRLCKG